MLIKWSIGQVCLGTRIESAFSEILEGGSEIAKFAFNDIFSMLKENSKLILYSMVVFGDEPVSTQILSHLSNLSQEDVEFSIRELTKASFVYSKVTEKETASSTTYSMLTLTRGFITTKLDEDEKLKNTLLTRNHHLTKQIADLEKAESSYSQTLFSLGVKSIDEKIAFDYVKTAKIKYYKGEPDEAEKFFEKAIAGAPTFSYAYIEYSKIEFRRGHHPKALELMKHATVIDPDNYHAWFSYGLMLRRQHQLDDSIIALIKAKELNPSHLPIYSELGRAYTERGNFDLAESELEEALREEKYPNPHHKAITLQFRADNYRQKGEAFARRHDWAGRKMLLLKAFETINEAMKVDSTDAKLLRTYWLISLDLGISLSQENKFDEGRKYLEICTVPYELGVGSYSPDKDIVAAACFNLAAYGTNTGKIKISERDNYIKKGLAVCEQNSPWHRKLNDLMARLNGEKPLSLENKKRRLGKVRFYDRPKKFGIVESGNDTYLFFPRSCLFYVNLINTQEIESAIVSFSLANDRGKLVAMDMNIENSI